MAKQAIAHIHDHQLVQAVTKGALCIWAGQEAKTLKSIRGELSSPLNGWHMFLAAPRLPVPWVYTDSWVILAV